MITRDVAPLLDRFYELQTEAEENCISIAIIAPHTVDLTSAIINKRDFVEALMGNIWQLIVDLREAGEGFDSKKFLTECGKRGYTKQLGGAAAIAKIINRAPNHAHAEYYARELARLSEIRRVNDAIKAAAYELMEPSVDPVKVAQFLQSRIEGVGTSKDAGFKSLGKVIHELRAKAIAHDEKVQEATVFRTGFRNLDRKIGGFSPGKLYLLGGRTGMGKSAIACNMAMQVARAGRTVWFCSLEMESPELAERILSERIDVEMDRWRGKLNVDELAAIGNYEPAASKLPFWLTDKGNESLSSLRAKARLRKSIGGLDLIVIDNLQLIKPVDYRAPKHERLKSMSEALKTMAKDIGVAILLLCQLSVEQSEGKGGAVKEPDNTSWADSKRIVDDADVAMILHRADRRSNEAKLILTKNRNGEECELNLNWEASFQRFSSPV